MDTRQRHLLLSLIHIYKELSTDIRFRDSYQAWIDSGGTLAFPNGESRKEFCKMCIRDRNGAGKSTILKSIARQLSLVSGTIYLDKSDVVKMCIRDGESTNDISFAGRLLQSILQLFAPLL